MRVRVGNQGMISSIGLYWDWSINQSIALLINQSNNWFTKRVFYIYEHIFISNSDPQWKGFVIKIQMYTHPSMPIHGVEKETDSSYSMFKLENNKRWG